MTVKNHLLRMIRQVIFYSKSKILLALRIFAWICLLACSNLLHAEVLLQPDTKSLNLSQHATVLVGAPKALTIEQVIRPDWQLRFVKPKVSGSALNLRVKSDPVWLRVDLNVLPDANLDWVLDIPYGYLKTIEWYLPRLDGSGYINATSDQQLTADYRYQAQSLRLSTGRVTLYARLEAEGHYTIPLEIKTEAEFIKQESVSIFLQAIYLGALLVLSAYAFLFGLSVRDKTYYIFSGYLFAISIAILVSTGMARMLFWSKDVTFEPALQATSFALVGALSLWFMHRFVHINEQIRKYDISFKILIGVYILLACSFIVRNTHTNFPALVDSALAVTTLISASLVITALLKVNAGSRGDRFFILAWLLVWFGAFIAALRMIDMVSSNLFSLYSIQITTGIAAILFSLALFMRIRVQDQRSVIAQQEVLATRQILIQTLQESERKLEATVHERTAQLQSLLEIEKRLREQYMRFGAMISHEFRNPLGVIETQVSLMQHELNSGINHVDKRIATVRSAGQRLALLFEKWLQSDRLQNATDTLQIQPIDLDRWLAELLNKCCAYHANHVILNQTSQTIGILNADERLLQIAVLNLIDNACKYSSANTTVTVVAKSEENQISIEVSDEGVGVPTEYLEKIFEEYFRIDHASPVLGVGLGLPFVRKIMRLHGGTVTASTKESGSGSRFKMTIPRQPMS